MRRRRRDQMGEALEATVSPSFRFSATACLSGRNLTIQHAPGFKSSYCEHMF